MRTDLPYIPLRESQIRRLESAEISVADLSIELGVSKNKLYHKIYKQNVKVPKVHWKSPKICDDGKKRLDEFIALRKNGISYTEVAKLYGMSRQRVSEVLHKVYK